MHKHFTAAHLDQSLSGLSIHFHRYIVKQNSKDDYHSAKAGEEGDLIAEQNDGGPDKKGSLAGVGHAVGDWADVVHEVVGGYRLTVEEDSVDHIAHEHLHINCKDRV